MASANVHVVNLDDDDVVPATPPSSRNRKRSLGSRSSSPDPFPFSPPLHEKLQLAASGSAPIDLDDTPPPPRRQPSSAPKPPPVHLVVDDDTDPSAVPDDCVAATPDSVLARMGFSETPELPGSRSVGPDIVVAETPGFTSPRSRRPPAAHRLSSAGPAHKSSGGSSVISLDSDDDDEEEEEDEALYKELAESPSDTADQNDGTTSYGQPIHADLPHEDSTLPDVDVGTGNNRPRGAKKRQTEEEKSKRQEAKRVKQEEKAKQAEERKRKQQENRAKKAELAEAKKKEKEISKWESGKYALNCITAMIDTNVVESGSVGGILLNSLEKKGLKRKVTDNPIKRSIFWKMEVPNDIAPELSSLNDGCDMAMQASVIELPYIAIVLQAEEFCDLVNKELIFKDVQDVRAKYPTYTICYVTNRVMGHIKKIDQAHFKNNTRWTPPPVEKILCKLATHYDNVHSRQCIDEAEVAEHLVGLTSSLAKCKFRKQLTWLSVNANGAVVPDNFIDKDLAKKDTWLKSLIAIPGVQAKCALAIWKEYPCMRSLLNVYMDPSKPVTEKELLLSDLKWEGPLSSKRLGQKCSRRVYRMLMAENGNLYTDTAETGA